MKNKEFHSAQYNKLKKIPRGNKYIFTYTNEEVT